MPLSRKVAPYADRIGRAKSTANIMPVTNPLERLNAEVKRRTDVMGIFPNDAAITRLIGVLLLEQNDEWQLQRRYSSLKAYKP